MWVRSGGRKYGILNSKENYLLRIELILNKE